MEKSGQRVSCLALSIYPEAIGGGKYMSPNERRQALLKALCLRRHDTYDNLAFEFNVSRRTVCRDVAILMCAYPIETVRGIGGGVKVADGFYLHRKAKTLTSKQTELLTRLRDRLEGDDLETLNSILLCFAP